MGQRNETAKWNTFFYIPNIIEYFRLTLLVVMFFAAFNAPVFAISYIICAHLDAIDGFAARLLKQESSLGAVLDYTIDRISIGLLCAVLIVLYPKAWAFFTFVLLLDIASHFCQLYSTIFLKLKNHKLVSEQQGKLLRIYYTNRFFMYYLCISHDLWLGSFYLYYFYPSSLLVSTLMFVLFPGFIMKLIVHILQITTSLRMIAEIN